MLIVRDVDIVDPKQKDNFLHFLYLLEKDCGQDLTILQMMNVSKAKKNNNMVNGESYEFNLNQAFKIVKSFIIDDKSTVADYKFDYPEMVSISSCIYQHYDYRNLKYLQEDNLAIQAIIDQINSELNEQYKKILKISANEGNRDAIASCSITDGILYYFSRYQKYQRYQN